MNQFWTESIEAKVKAGLASILYRQGLSETGGIVESDPRVDRANYLYKDRCWPRIYHIEPLLLLKEYDAVLKNLAYWKNAFELSGDNFFRHNYHYQSGAKLSEHKQIDNNAHMMLHICLTAKHCNADVIKPFLGMLEACGDYLQTCLDPDMDLLRGIEERIVGGITFPECFSFYINRVCAEALERSAALLDKPEWVNTAARIRKAVRSRLWDNEKQSYAYLMFVPDADHEYAGLLSHDESWGLLWPYMHDHEYQEKDQKSVHQRIDALWHVDPLLPEFICQKEPKDILKLLETGDNQPAFHYSGVGVCPAANAVAAMILAEKEGDTDTALELWKPLENCPGDMDQIPEHINTMHPGRMKDYMLWPDEKSLVDSGNLMHLTMFMTAALRLKAWHNGPLDARGSVMK